MEDSKTSDNEQRYRSLYTKTPVMMHSLDSDRRLVDVTDLWLHVLGYPRYAESISMDDFYGKGNIVDLPFQVVKRDGEIIDVLLSAIAEYDDQGRFERSLEVLTDVTERNRAEEALRRARDEMEARVKDRTAELERQRRFLRQVIDTDPNFVFAKDREGRFTLVNQAIAKAYGTSVEELIGKRDADFSSNWEEVEYFLRMDREVMETRVERFIPEEPFTDTEGKLRWLQTVKRPLVDDAGRCNLVLGSATDITQRREAEERLRGSEAALRRSQGELQTLAGRLLTAQEDERRRLAREMHDDLTQRLAGIALQAGRLQRMLTPLTDEASAVLEGVLFDLRKLSSDVHALSRRLHPSILDDLGLVDAIAAECDGIAQRESIAVHFESDDVPSDLSNAASLCLYRVTQEALRNVEKHAGTTEARVFLTGEAGALTLTIEDRGKGFDYERGRSGEGLGLASMEERARLIGAEFSVRSVRGEGTTVRVRLVDGTSAGL